MHPTPDPQTQPAPPWWKFGYVWLVIAGPAVVVVAGFATLWLALANPETLVADDSYRRAVENHRELAAGQVRALTPALQGRNHAATAAPTPR